MALPGAYAQYQNNKVLTASPAELTLMLYDGAIKFCNIAMMAIDSKDVQKAYTNIVKAEKIIDYLRVTLDMRYPVAKDFENIPVVVGGSNSLVGHIDCVRSHRCICFPSQIGERPH